MITRKTGRMPGRQLLQFLAILGIACCAHAFKDEEFKVSPDILAVVGRPIAHGRLALMERASCIKSRADAEMQGFGVLPAVEGQSWRDS